MPASATSAHACFHAANEESSPCVKHFPGFSFLWFVEADSPLEVVLGHYPVNFFHGLIKYTTIATKPY